MVKGASEDQWSSTELRSVSLVWEIAQMALFASVSLLCMLRTRLASLRGFDWEAFTIAVILLVLQFPILNRPSMCHSWRTFGGSFDCSGVDLTEAGVLGTELRALGFMTVLMTAVHLFLPIRSCRVWLMDVIATCEYAACAVAAAQQGHYFLPTSELISVMGPLAGLVLFAYLGGRFAETHNRANWLTQGKLLEQQLHLDQQQLAMSRILSRLCDSLVHLGSAFQILQPCPQLDALLFRHKSVGRNFCDFIASESSKELFSNQLCNPVSGTVSVDVDGGLTGMMNLSLSDSNGQVVKVYAHHACFHASDGTTQYLLGLIETGERPAPIPEPEAPPVPHSMALPELSGELGMTVETNEDGEFVITDMKPGMNSLFSEVSEGDSLDTICDEKDQRRLLAWMQHNCNAATEAGLPKSAMLNCLNITARPRHGDSVLYIAKVIGTFRHDDEERDVVVLKFCAPDQAGSRRSRSQSASSRSQSRSSRSMSRSSRSMSLSSQRSSQMSSASSRSSLNLAGLSQANPAVLERLGDHRLGHRVYGNPLSL